MAQTLPFVKAVERLKSPQIFIRRGMEFLVPQDVDLLYLQKNEIEVV